MSRTDERDAPSAVARARLSLHGLSIGDAFGQRFFVSPAVIETLIRERAMPPAPWQWTDDTAMALSVFEVLAAHGGIDRDALAARFARRYRRDPDARLRTGRASGSCTPSMAACTGEKPPPNRLGGRGSMGNGSAMRVAPVGGYFADDLEQAAAHARASAEPTHAHPDAQAGAVAVAVAAAVAWQMGNGGRERSGPLLLREVIARTPSGPTRDGIERAASLPFEEDPLAAVEELGNGSRVICSDTVPFSLWCAARHLGDFEEALWTTVSGLGDRDTTCAIVGGVVALSVGPAGIPEAFCQRARAPRIGHESRGGALMDTLRLPAALEQSQRVLVAGAGGGFDVYAGLPIYERLRTLGKDVFLANLSFTYLGGTNAKRVAGALHLVEPDTEGGDGYFPERTLARFLSRRGTR